MRATHIQVSIVCTQITLTWDAPWIANKRCLNLLTYTVISKFWSPSLGSFNSTPCKNTTAKRCEIQLPSKLSTISLNYHIETLLKKTTIGETAKVVLLPYRNCKKPSRLILNII